MSSEESLYLLATCYYRSGKPNAAYSILLSFGCRTSQCRLLLARCCVDLKKFAEAEEAILGNFQNDNCFGKTVPIEDLIKEFGESASFAAQLLGTISIKNERHSNASFYFKQSLKANPFLWSSFEGLMQLGEKVNPNELFNISNVDFSLCHGNNPLVNLWNNTSSKALDSVTSQQIINTKMNMNKCEINSPFAVIKSISENGSIDVITPENNIWVTTTACLAPSKQNAPTKITKKSSLNIKNENVTPNLITNNPTTPSGRHNFGVFPLTEGGALTLANNLPFEFDNMTHSNDQNIHGSIIRKPHTRRSQQIQQSKQTTTRNSAPKLQICNNQSVGLSETVSSSIPSSISGSIIQTRQMNTEQGQSLRRSSRLFSSSNSVKENSKAPAKMTRPRTPTKRAKRTNSSSNISTVTNTNISQQKQKETELNELNKNDGGKCNNYLNEYDLIQTGIKMQKASAEGLLDLLSLFGKALLELGQFNCQSAIDALTELPGNHLNTGWVLSALGRAYFEMTKYDEAVEYFQKAHKYEPHRLQGMEYFSTALWHLQKEVELSMLAQELIEFDKNAAQTWCAAGNCFSLQKEHETSIKFLQRAIQVDPDFAYAYTLLGHELAVTDEMDQALSCFRNATRIDPRHYNAWYGIGMIYYKQEKFSLAEMHYRKALLISPYSPVLMCHIGVVQHALKKSDQALLTLNKAIEMDPKNALCKFHRASIYFALDKHQQALQELEELKQIVPDESLVYFLIGKVNNKFNLNKFQYNNNIIILNFRYIKKLETLI